MEIELMYAEPLWDALAIVTVCLVIFAALIFLNIIIGTIINNWKGRK